MGSYSSPIALLVAVLIAVVHARVGNNDDRDDVAATERLSYRGAHNARQQKIVDMMRHAWKGYTRSCWGADELHPIGGTCASGWHMGLTMVDGLDTLYLMGLDKEYKAARDWLADPNKLDFRRVHNVNLFETTIRVLGGLLGAHALTGDPVLLNRAKELGSWLLPGLRGPNNVPFSDFDVAAQHGSFLGGDASTAEATTLGLEFRTLSQLTGDPIYAQTVDKIGAMVHRLHKKDGLVMNHISQSGYLESGLYSLGSRGDSYYEYLLKQWLQSGKKDTTSLQDYLAAMKGVQKHLIKHTNGPLHLTYVAELVSDRVNPKMDHLVCFLPGVLALGSHNGLDQEHLVLAKKLMRTCYQMYNASGHNLGPEIAYFETNGQELLIKPADSHDILRPETVESLFYLHRLTGDKMYQDWGWEIAQAIEKYAKVDSGGYTSLASVFNLEKRNKMESFFLAETLKYLFLLFDDSDKQVPLDKFVFNTEGHPLRIEGESPPVTMSKPSESGGAHGHAHLSLAKIHSGSLMRRQDANE